MGGQCADHLDLRVLFRFLFKLHLLDVFSNGERAKRQFPRLGKLRHRLSPSAEETQNLVQQPVPRHDRLEDIRVPDLPHPAHSVV